MLAKKSPKSASNPHRNPRTKNPPKIRTKRPREKSTHKKSTQNIRTKICTTKPAWRRGRSKQLSSRPPPTQDSTTTVGEDLRWAQEQIEIVLPLMATTHVCSLLEHHSLTLKKSPHETKNYFSRLWRENPLGRNRSPTFT